VMNDMGARSALKSGMLEAIRDVRLLTSENACR
jgi:hypothetical protein